MSVVEERFMEDMRSGRFWMKFSCLNSHHFNLFIDDWPGGDFDDDSRHVEGLLQLLLLLLLLLLL